MPSLRQILPNPRPDPKMVAAPMPTHLADLASMALYGFGAIPTIGSADSAGDGDNDGSSNQGDSGELTTAVATDSERPLKRRLRPRKARD